MFCMKCGTQLPDDALFCYKCGFKLPSIDKSIKEDQTPGKDFLSNDEKTESANKNSNDILSRLFENQEEKPKNDFELPNQLDILTEIKISHKEAVSGTEKEFSFDRDEKCEYCQGSGIEPEKICSRCNGEGHIRVTKRTRLKTTYSTEPCPICKGSGKIASDSSPCQKCHGKGIMKTQKIVVIKVPAGIQEGKILRLKEEGNIDDTGVQKGDLYVQIKYKKNAAQFEDTEENTSEKEDYIYYIDSKGNDLLCDIVMNRAMAESYEGVIVDTDLGEVEVEIPDDIKDSATFVMKEKGVPGQNGRGRGDMIVSMKVVDNDQPLEYADKSQASFIEKIERRNDDLLCDIVMNRATVKSYGVIVVDTEFGEVEVEIPDDIEDSATFVMKEKGAPRQNGRGRGDMIVSMKVVDNDQPLENETTESDSEELAESDESIINEVSLFRTDRNARCYTLGDKEIRFSDKYSVYSELVKILNKQSRKAVKEFSSSYSDWGDAATVSARASGKLRSLLQEGFMACKPVALRNGVNDYNISKIRDYTWGRITDTFVSVLANMDRQLRNINQAQSEEELEREIRKESRTRFFGVGFGVEGFVKATLAAGALNMGTGLVHSAFNMIGNTFTALSANSERSDLYDNSLFGLQIDVRESFELLLNEIGKIVVGDVHIDKEKEQAIVKNIKDGSFGEGTDLRRAFADAFQAFPFDDELYIAYMRLYPEDEKKIMSMAEYLGMELEDTFYELFHFNGFTFHSLSSVEYVKSIEKSFLQNIDLLAKFYDKEKRGFRVSQELFKEKFLKEYNSLEIVDGLLARYMTPIVVPPQYEEVKEYLNRKCQLLTEVRNVVASTCTETPLHLKVNIGFAKNYIAFYLRLGQLLYRWRYGNGIFADRFIFGSEITSEEETKIRNMLWKYKDASDIYFCYKNDDKYLVMTSDGIVSHKLSIGLHRDMEVSASKPGTFGVSSIVVNGEVWEENRFEAEEAGFIVGLINGILPFCEEISYLIDLKKEGIEKGNLQYLHAIAAMYNNGNPKIGLARDYPRAKFWYQKAADLGDIDSQNWLANKYLEWAEVEPVSEEVAMEDFNFPVSNNAQSSVSSFTSSTASNVTPTTGYVEDYTPKFEQLKNAFSEYYLQQWSKEVEILNYITKKEARKALDAYVSSWSFTESQVKVILKQSGNADEGFIMTEGYLITSEKPNILLALNEIDYLRIDRTYGRGTLYTEPANIKVGEIDKDYLSFIEKLNEIVFGYNTNQSIISNNLIPEVVDQGFIALKNDLPPSTLSDLDQISEKILLLNDIPDKKARNVVCSYAEGLGIQADDIKLLYDHTVFGNAKDGMVMTNQFIIDHMNKKPIPLNQVQYLRVVTVDDNKKCQVYAEPMHLWLMDTLIIKSDVLKPFIDKVNQYIFGYPEKHTGTASGSQNTVTNQQYVCPSCGRLINFKDAFCDNCGTQISWGDETRTQSITSTNTQDTAAQQYVCPSCGHSIEYNDAFCDNCGTQLTWG